MRLAGFPCIAAVVALAASGAGFGAGAQTSAPSEYASCPRGRLSIYFASGEATASPQAVSLIDHISETAASCSPDGIDLVARIDAHVDGDRAMALALERLNTVADDLISRGVPVERIRVAAQAAGIQAVSSLNQIDVMFRKSSDTPEDVATPPKIIRLVPSEAI